MAESTPAYVGCKPCARCKRIKPLSQFGRHRHGHVTTCKSCVDAVRRRQLPAVPDESKTCNTCGVLKPLSHYYRNGGRHRPVCKACVCAALRQRYHERPEVREAEAARRARYYNETSETRRAYAVEYRCQNPSYLEQDRQRRRDRDSETRDHVRARAAKWRTENAERHRQNGRRAAARRRAENPEPIREEGRRARHRRRARMAGLPVEAYTLEQLVDRDGTDCVLCGEAVDFSAAHPQPLAPTVEHLECISWPNSPGDVLSNVAIAHFFCNTARHTRPHPAAARKRAELLAAERVS